MFIVNCSTTGDLFSFDNISDAIKKAIWLSSTIECGFCHILEKREGQDQCVKIGHTYVEDETNRMTVSLSYPMDQAKALMSNPVRSNKLQSS